MTPPLPQPHEGLNAAVAATLRAEKAAQDMTNDDLADNSGIPKGSVQRYLAAKRHIDVVTLEALARALHSTPRLIVQAAEERLAREADFPRPSARVFRLPAAAADDDLEVAAHDSEGSIEEEQEASDTP